MPKSGHDDEVPRSLPWMNSYADMVTLLWTFFILLFSLSVINAKKFQTGVGSVQSAFGALGGSYGPGIFEGAGPTPTSDLSRVAAELASLEAQGEAFQRELEQSGLADKVSIEMDERGLVFRFEDSLLFDLGSADIRTDARPVLMEIGELIKKVSYPVRIEGHTDNWPISTDRFPSNWELSTARASSVVRFFIENLGFDPKTKTLEAAGYGEYRPLESNATAEGRQRNRRVDILLLRPSLAELEPKVEPGTGP